MIKIVKTASDAACVAYTVTLKRSDMNQFSLLEEYIDQSLLHSHFFSKLLFLSSSMEEEQREVLKSQMKVVRDVESEREVVHARRR